MKPDLRTAKFDRAKLTCEGCGSVREFRFDPPIVGGLALDAWVSTNPLCKCGTVGCHLEANIVSPT